MITNQTINNLIAYFKGKEERTIQEEDFLHELSMYSESFPIVDICREDLESRGFDTTNVTNEDMCDIADSMRDSLFDQSYWEIMTYTAEDFEIPKR